MRRRIKPIVVAVFFSLFGLLLIIGHLHSTNTLKKELVEAKKTIPSVKASKVPQKSTSSKDKEFVLKRLSMSLVGNFLRRLITIRFQKIFQVLLFVSLVDQRYLRLITLLIQLESINRLRPISKNFKSEISQ